MSQRMVPRLREFGTTIFAEMSALAVATGSVNLGQGFPDTDGPAELLDAAVAAIRDGVNQYPPGPGVPALRAAVAAHQDRNYGLAYDPDTEVLVTAGATEAIAAAMLSLAGPGDEVVLFEPFYDSYAASVALGGATRRVVTLRPPPARAGEAQGWTFDPAELDAAVTPATRVIVLNTPHNPTGTVFDSTQLAAVADVARRHDLVVVSDEVYEHLTFDGARHVPIATLPGMRERTVTIGSAGKTFAVTGWKIGWACAPVPLLTALRTAKQFLTYVNGAPFQPAVASVLDRAETLAPRAALQAQRDLLCDGLAELGFRVLRPQATYFATVDIGGDALATVDIGGDALATVDIGGDAPATVDIGGDALATKNLGDAVAFCRELPVRAGVVAIPSSAFYDSDAGDRFVRFAFCKRPEVLDEALRRLRAAR